MARKTSSAKTTLPEKTLREAVEATQVAEVLKASTEDGSVRLLFRVTQKKTWLAILEQVLRNATSWTAHVCQQYFIRDGRLVYGWNFILRPNSGRRTEEAVSEAATLLAQASREASRALAPVTVDSFPLIGASPRRTAQLVFDPRAPGPQQGGPSHKGAYGVISSD